MVTGGRTTGAARWFTDQQLGGPALEKESSVNVLSTLSVVIGSNPDRVGLIMINQGAQDAFIALTPAVSTSFGIKLFANGGSVTMQVRDDFTLPSRQWYGFGNGGAVSIYVLEQISETVTPASEKP